MSEWMLLELLFKITFLGGLVAYLTPMKYTVKKSVLIVAGFHFFIWIANYVCYAYISNAFISDFLLFTIGIPGFVCFNLVARYKGFRVLFSQLSVALFSMFSSFIGNLPFRSSPVLQYGLKYGSFILIIIYIVKVFKKPYFKMFHTLEKGWGPLCLIPFCLINIVSLLQYYPTPIEKRPENIPILIAVFVLTFLLYAILYFNFENIAQLFRLKRDKELLAVQTEMYAKQYESMTENILAIKIFRHDMRHHLNAINTLLKNENIVEAKKYVTKVDDGLNNVVVEQYCENYAVNVILSFYIQKARDQQIEVECKAEIPDHIPIDAVELGLVFANLLENAINACMRIEPTSERKIAITCKPHCGQIFIRISNPFAGEVKFDGEYPVSEETGHGIGTRSIAAIAQKYEGVSSFTAQDGFFHATLAIKYL